MPENDGKQSAPAPKAPKIASEDLGPKLDGLDRARLETLLWKQRALSYRADQADFVAREKRREAREAELSFLSLAKSRGIDSSRAFEWDEDGQVVYLEPAPDAAPKPAGEKK